MKQKLGVALSVLFISSACFAMGMLGAWVDPSLMRQDVTRVGSQGASRLASTPAEVASGYPACVRMRASITREDSQRASKG